MLKAAPGIRVILRHDVAVLQVNVFSSMNFLLKYSEPIRELVRKGELDIQGQLIVS